MRIRHTVGVFAATVMVAAVLSSAGCTTGRAGCFDECFAGTTRCNGDSVESCGDYDEDACNEFGNATACNMGDSCSNGACGNPAVCSDDCAAAGTTVCVGDSFLSCGESDSDTCLDLSAPTACPAGESCSNGMCALTCMDECVMGASECLSGGVQRTCATDWDSDPCYDWGPAMPCNAGEACVLNGNVGACGPVTCNVTASDLTKTSCELLWDCPDTGDTYAVYCYRELPTDPWQCFGSENCVDCSPDCTWQTSENDPCATHATGGCGFPSP